jgi:hypothetical protein
LDRSVGRAPFVDESGGAQLNSYGTVRNTLRTECDPLSERNVILTANRGRFAAGPSGGKSGGEGMIFTSAAQETVF